MLPKINLAKLSYPVLKTSLNKSCCFRYSTVWNSTDEQVPDFDPKMSDKEMFDKKEADTNLSIYFEMTAVMTMMTSFCMDPASNQTFYIQIMFFIRYGTA